MTASIPLARRSSTLRSRAAAFCASADTTRIFASGPSSPKARAAWRKTAGSTKRKISGAWARTAEPKVSVCQPFTTTTARAMAARSGELKMNGGDSAPAAARGLKTSKPTSSSSVRLRGTYLRCWRTKKPCNSKYSRTIVSLTAAISGGQRRGAKRGFVQGPLDRRRRHFHAPADLADFFSEHELDFTSFDFLVETQGGQQPGAPRARQLDSRGQTRGREQLPDSLQLTRREAGEFGGKVGGDHLADGNRFAMKIFSVAGDCLDGMADGVAEVQNFAQPGLGFVLAHDLRLDGAAAFDHDLQQFGIEFQQFGQLAFEQLEQGRIVNDSVLDDLGKAGAELPRGQGAESVQVAEDQARLMKGAHEVLAGRNIYADFAADGTVHLGEQSRGHLHEGDAAQIRGGHKSGDVAHHAAADGDDEGAAFEPVFGQVVVAALNGLEALGSFAGGKSHHGAEEAGFFETGHRGAGEAPRHVGVREEGVARTEIELATFIAQARDQIVTDQNRVASLAQENLQRGHGASIGVEGAGVKDQSCGRVRSRRTTLTPGAARCHHLPQERENRSPLRGESSALGRAYV